MVHGGNDEEEFVNISSVATKQLFYVVGTGLPPSTSVGKAIINLVFEYFPTAAGYPLAVMDYPQPGPMTVQFESVAFSRFPVLQCLTRMDAQRVATYIPDAVMPFNSLMNVLSSALSNITIVENTPIVARGIPDMEMEQPEFMPFSYTE